MTGIIEAIDQAISCQRDGCNQPISSSVSDDFCSQDCQTAWHAARAEPIPALFNGFAMPDMEFPQQAPTELPVWHREPITADPERVPPPVVHRSLTHDFLVAVGFHTLVAVTAISHRIERMTAPLRRAGTPYRSSREG